MSALVLPVAHHVVAALPFVMPMILIVGGLVFLMVRDRLAGHRDD